MTALLYIFQKSMKNRIREVRQKPKVLALYAVVLIAIVGTIIPSFFGTGYTDDPSEMFMLTLMFFGLFLFLFVASVIKGLASGEDLFGMYDVNMVFTSPISQDKVLVYGMMRMMKDALWGSFFIVFQANTLSGFGIGPWGLVPIIFAYTLAVIVMAIMSIVIYRLTFGDPRRKNIVKVLLGLFLLPFILLFGIGFIETGDPLIVLENIIHMPFFDFVPIMGWTAAGVVALFEGRLAASALFFMANILLGAGMMLYIMLSGKDYYEDAIVSAQNKFQAQRDAAEGNIFTGKKNVKVVKTGVKGAGATAIFYKHLRESFRQSPLGVVGVPTLLMLVGTIVFVFFAGSLIIALQILLWLAVFSFGLSRGIKETSMHYIYMIPEPSFNKILYSNMDVMLKSLVEGVLIFVIAGAIIGENALVILGCILVYVLFKLLMTGVNYFYLRFVGRLVNSGILIFVYFASVVVAVLPGAIAALVVGFVVGGLVGAVIGLFILAGWLLVAGVGLIYVSRGVLDNCDMPVNLVK